MRNALIATRSPPKSPLQVSATHPDGTAMSSHFSSPVEMTSEVGSCAVALHKLPKAVKNFTLCESRVGYAFTETVDQGFPKERASELDIPDRTCL